MLKTPLGEIEIRIDDAAIEYTAVREKTGSPWDEELDGRYFITVNIPEDGNKHYISCIIKDYDGSDEDYEDTGERLELKNFIKNGAKLSIGTEGDSSFPREYQEYDYNIEYLNNGMAYITGRETKTTRFVFGIAWINNPTAENDAYTWYGADPFGLRLEKKNSFGDSENS